MIVSERRYDGEEEEEEEVGEEEKIQQKFDEKPVYCNQTVNGFVVVIFFEFIGCKEVFAHT